MNASWQLKPALISGGPRFGAHMSIAGGLHNAFEHGEKAGCDALQVFSKNQRQWSAPPLTDEEIETWISAGKRSQIGPVIAHATYLINMAAEDTTQRDRSTDAFITELKRCDQLGIVGLVVHPGAHVGAGEEVGCRNIAKCLDRAVDETGGAVTELLLEITAGQGSSIGCTFEHIRDILGMVRDNSRIGVCFDTCHALAAGYAFDTAAAYDAMWADFDRCIGLSRLKCFHLNDSKRELGSRVDRHEAIGKGFVGLQAFWRIVNDPRMVNVPMMMETPKGEADDGTDLDVINLKALRDLIGLAEPPISEPPVIADKPKPAARKRAAKTDATEPVSSSKKSTTGKSSTKKVSVKSKSVASPQKAKPAEAKKASSAKPSVKKAKKK